MIPPTAGVRDPEVPIDPAALVPHYCQPGLHYHVSNGYRHIAGDSCVGGVQHEMLIHPCPGSTWTHHVSHGGWTVLLVLITLGSAMLAITYFSGPMKRPTGASRFGGGSSGLSNKPEATLPRWVPAALARPVAVVAAVVSAVVHASVTIIMGAVEFSVNLFRRLSGAPPVRSSPGFSTRGLGRGSAAPGVKYDAVGRGGAVPDSASAEDVEAGAHSGGGNDDDEFGSFGVDGSDDVEAPSRFTASDPDLLNLRVPATGSDGSSARSHATHAGSSEPVPALRPPRSHAESASALRSR